MKQNRINSYLETLLNVIVFTFITAYFKDKNFMFYHVRFDYSYVCSVICCYGIRRFFNYIQPVPPKLAIGVSFNDHTVDYAEYVAWQENEKSKSIPPKYDFILGQPEAMAEILYSDTEKCPSCKGPMDNDSINYKCTNCWKCRIAMRMCS